MDKNQLLADKKLPTAYLIAMPVECQPIDLYDRLIVRSIFAPGDTPAADDLMDAPQKIILWPDPRLRKISAAVTQFDASLKQLTDRMFELMREAKGVGLAAPQVGQNLRLFVVNHDGDPAHDRVYANPMLSDADGDEEDEEGCLSLPKVNINVFRSKAIKIQAQDLTGQPFEQTEIGYLPRIWQHETDHLNGIMLTDRMGPVAKMTYRKILRDLEERYAEQNPKHPVRRQR